MVARLFEKLIFYQLYTYLSKSNLIYWGQSVYRKLHSTVTSLINNTDKWYRGMDNGCISGTVFIDLKKAFDTVDHAILCHTLEHYGLQLNELLWSSSYHFNRRKYCRVGGYDSNICNIDVGVPKGSCLGPLLFSIYKNDLLQVVKASTVFMHAGGTSLTFQSQDFSQLNETINNDLASLGLWKEGNQLSLNVSKTHSMLICTKTMHQELRDYRE